MGDISEFDRPLFKRLAHNDTGAAVGHQAGILIPAQMDPYFPDLHLTVSSPAAVYDNIRAMLFVGDTPKGVVSTSYQYQTWGGTRSPERRLTGNLTALRNAAVEGDYVLIERSTGDPWLYRLRLLKIGTPEHSALAAKVGGRKWGPVDTADKPVSEAAVSKAEEEQTKHESKPLALFDNDAALKETRSNRIARSRAFQKKVAYIYSFRCAVCGLGLGSPLGASEVESAHIVPRGMKGADDARNGLALCRSHHWAFDHGLFGVAGGNIFIPPKVSSMGSNAHIAIFASKALTAPIDPALKPAPEAFKWHMENIVAPNL